MSLRLTEAFLGYYSLRMNGAARGSMWQDCKMGLAQVLAGEVS